MNPEYIECNVLDSSVIKFLMA